MELQKSYDDLISIHESSEGKLGQSLIDSGVDVEDLSYIERPIVSCEEEVAQYDEEDRKKEKGKKRKRDRREGGERRREREKSEGRKRGARNSSEKDEKERGYKEKRDLMCLI